MTVNVYEFRHGSEVEPLPTVYEVRGWGQGSAVNTCLESSDKDLEVGSALARLLRIPQGGARGVAQRKKRESEFFLALQASP